MNPKSKLYNPIVHTIVSTMGAGSISPRKSRN
jgi:hypothetical protein